MGRRNVKVAYGDGRCSLLGRPDGAVRYHTGRLRTLAASAAVHEGDQFADDAAAEDEHAVHEDDALDDVTHSPKPAGSSAWRR